MTFLTKDRALALVTLAVVAIMFAESTSIPARTSWQPYGSAFFPQLLLAVAGVLAVLLLARSFLPGAPRQAPVIPEIVTFLKANYRIVTVFAMFALYTAFLPVVGYITATAGFLIASLGLLSGFATRRNAVVTLALAIVVPLLIFALFEYGLGVRLP